MLLNMAAEMVEKLQREFQEADTEEKENFKKSLLSLIQTIIGDYKKTNVT